MKQIYESFQEIAEDYRKARFEVRTSSPPAVEIMAQKRAMEFARCLDDIGVKMIENPEISKKLRAYFKKPPSRKSFEGKLQDHNL